MQPIDREAIEHDWNKRGFSFGIWCDEAGQIWENYVHDTDELFMLVEGEVELSIEGKTIIPKIGEEILIPANSKHTVKNIGKTENSWYYGYKKA